MSWLINLVIEIVATLLYMFVVFPLYMFVVFPLYMVLAVFVIILTVITLPFRQVKMNKLDSRKMKR